MEERGIRSDKINGAGNNEMISENRTSLCLYLGEYHQLRTSGKAILQDRFLKRKSAVFEGAIIALAYGTSYHLGRVLSVHKKKHGLSDVEVCFFFD